jgi:transmembrane sensor
MNVSKQLLRKYLDGHCTPEEESTVAEWLGAQTGTKKPLHDLLDESWEQAGEQATPDMAAANVKKALQQKLYPNYKPATILWRSAAAVIILFVASLLILNRPTKPTKPVLAATQSPVITRITNSLSLNHTYTLPDHSLATLAPASSLSYQNDDKGRRLIHLQGEGFFDVQKDTAHPFTVQAGSLSVTALGTSFRISDRMQPGQIVVQLYTGKVKLTQQQGKPVIMKPGQQFTFNTARCQGVLAAIPVPNKHRTINKPVPAPPQQGPADDGSWTFTSRPLQEVISILQVRYHTPIQYNPAHLSGKYFTGTLSATDSLPFILSSVAALNGLRVTMTDSTITLEKDQ